MRLFAPIASGFVVVLAGLLVFASACRPGAEGSPAGELWREFSGARAFAQVEKLVALGPRPSGSPALEKTRKFLEAELAAAGWTVERQAFREETPRGSIEFVNLIARFRDVSAKDPRALVCTHYDTKYFEAFRFVGANDGGSGTGALLELARVLALRPHLARRVELVFFDGEEASVKFSAFDGLDPVSRIDGLHGSRHYARSLRDSGRARQFRFGVLWDMIGDRDLGLTLPNDSPAQLLRGIFASADALNLRPYFHLLNGGMLDDHTPLNKAGVPTIDLIDFDFPPWHTAGDTIETVGPESLEIVGRVTVHYLGSAGAGLE
jgi:glutaminyl-peptide cyclotransferase